MQQHSRTILTKVIKAEDSQLTLNGPVLRLLQAVNPIAATIAYGRCDMNAPALAQPASTWPPLVGRKLVAELLGYHPRTIINMESDGRLPRAHRLSARRFVYRREVLLAALQALLGAEVVPS